MPKLSHGDVLKLARLARLRLSEGEISLFQSEVSAILGYVEKLRAVDVGGLEPTSQVTGLTSVMRPDKVRDYGATPSELLKNVPSTDKGHIKVRRVLE